MFNVRKLTGLEVFCKVCNNEICKYNREGLLEIICPHCRTINSYIGKKAHQVGSIAGDFKIDSDKHICSRCYRPIAKTDGDAQFISHCRVCGMENTNSSEIPEPAYQHHQAIMTTRGTKQIFS